LKFKKKKSSPEPASQIQLNLIKIILGSRKFKFVQIKGQVLIKRGDTHKKCKIGLGLFKNLENQLAKFKYKLSLGEGNSSLSILRVMPSSKGRKSQKWGRGHLMMFSRSTGPTSARLGINHPWEKGIQVSSNEGDCPSQRGGGNGKRVNYTEQF
jgi:hypothetical protein